MKTKTTPVPFSRNLLFPSFRTVLLPTLLGCLGLPGLAAVKPNGLFSDGAVLQRRLPVPVWGSANDGETITVKFHDQTVHTAAKNGRWMVRLKPMEAGGPFVMTITGENTVTFTNILLGEVWLCSGQSNMEMPLAATTNAAAAITAAGDPQLHLFSVPHGMADEPKTEVSGAWTEATPGSAKYFSAVAYYFGRDLRKALHVPVGLIHASVGGTPAEAWTAYPALERDPALVQILERQAQAVKNFDPTKAEAQHEAAVVRAKAEGQNVSKVPAVAKSPALSNGRPSVLYNAMIAPLQPFAMAGVIWYQGEQNNWHPLEYRTLFPTLIRNWRNEWGEGDFPFLFVQIAPHHDMKPELREAQFLTWQKTPRTVMAVITDVGEANNIHPVQKEPVGARLALAARAVAYRENIEFSGPVYNSVKFEGSTVTVSFTHVGGGLMAKHGDLKGFTIAGDDGIFVHANAEIHGNKVVVSCPSVVRPEAVRFGWANVPDVNFFNLAGLPAPPFRTDVK